MALSTREPPKHTEPPAAAGAGAPWRRSEVLVAAAVAVIALGLAVSTHARHPHALPDLARGTLASLLIFLVCGYGAAAALVPRQWGPLSLLLSLPLGAAISSLALTALGFAHVPLSVGLWIVLAAGVIAAVAVRRRGHSPGPLGSGLDYAQLGAWIVVLVVVWCLALIPSWRSASDTIYGENPDAHQVVGIAVLFQHVPPTATDVALPIDTVPSAWRFRYPIFYALAGASNLSHLDPIKVFPALAALLLALSALGFGALVVVAMRGPPASGMVAAAAIGLATIPLDLVWHPYWNQLWGLAILPYALLFGWRAVTAGDGRAWLLFALMLVSLWLAYPLALPYPLVLVAAVALANWRRPRLPNLRGSRAWIAAALAALVLLPALVGAALKVGQGIGQFFSPHSSLWGGDVKQLMPVGRFVGTGGGILPALAVLVAAGFGIAALPRRARIAVGAAVAVLCLVDIRFRVARTGAYMDFKHLSFVGALILMLAAAGVSRLLFSRSWLRIAAGLALALAWVGAALVQDHRLALRTQEQVTSELLQIRSWASALPRGASVRVDVPPSGTQLWAVYMLGDHPVDSPHPVLGTTYARAHFGLRAQYSLALRSASRPQFATDPPLFENDEFVLRRINWPARLANYPHLASTRLVEP